MLILGGPVGITNDVDMAVSDAVRRDCDVAVPDNDRRKWG